MSVDLKRALAAYVAGRNGGWDSELKSVSADGTPAAEPDADDEPSGRVEPAAHVGVPVPERLAFERGPGTWRTRLEDVPRR